MQLLFNDSIYLFILIMLKFLFNYKHKIACDCLNYTNCGDQLKKQKKNRKYI